MKRPREKQELYSKRIHRRIIPTIWLLDLSNSSLSFDPYTLIDSNEPPFGEIFIAYRISGEIKASGIETFDRGANKKGPFLDHVREIYRFNVNVRAPSDFYGLRTVKKNIVHVHTFENKAGATIKPLCSFLTMLGDNGSYPLCSREFSVVDSFTEQNQNWRKWD